MKIAQINFTRFLAAFGIVVFHYGRHVPLFNTDSYGFIFNNANIGVSYFYVLSGFIMIIAYNKGNFKIDAADYYKNRIARIYPLYLLGIVLMCWLEHKYTLKNLLLNLFGAQALVPGEATSINGPGWSISVEFFFYLLFPLLLNYVYLKTNKALWAFGALALCIATQVFTEWFLQSSHYHGYPSPSHDFIYYGPWMHINQFILGNIAGLYFAQLKRRPYDLLILIVFALAVLMVKWQPLQLHNGTMALFFVPLIMLISANTGIITKLFSFKPLVLLGEISFGMYILQAPVHLWFLQLCKKHNAFVLQDQTNFFFSYVAVLIAISIIAHFVIEQPLRNAIKRIRFKSSSKQHYTTM